MIVEVAIIWRKGRQNYKILPFFCIFIMKFINNGVLSVVPYLK